MFCSSCKKLIKEIGEKQFKDKEPDKSIDSSSLSIHNINSVLLTIYFRHKNGVIAVEKESINEIFNYCTFCGESLKK